jgi:hypothetical protein
LKRYDANLRGCICCEGYVVMAPTEYGIGEYVTHKDAAATIQRLEAEIAEAKEQSDQFRDAYRRLFDRRAMRVVDLKIKVWEALNRRACPDGFMHIATEAIMEFGCGEIADLKKAKEQLEAEIAPLRALFPHGPLHEQVAAVLGDAERYRWLRNESWACYNISKKRPQVFETVTMVEGFAHGANTVLAEEALDAAIDAALQAGAKGDQS